MLILGAISFCLDGKALLEYPIHEDKKFKRRMTFEISRPLILKKTINNRSYTKKYNFSILLISKIKNKLDCVKAAKLFFTL